MRYGPLQQIWLYAMGHYSEFGYTLWATAANLEMCYGPLRQILLFSILLFFTAVDLVMRYGPLHGMKPLSKNL
jgi:hypothetical protein